MSSLTFFRKQERIHVIAEKNKLIKQILVLTSF